MTMDNVQKHNNCMILPFDVTVATKGTSYVVTNVTKENTASIFREKSSNLKIYAVCV
jgi:hypothetical protein